jgi:glutamate 5-kinase
MGVVPIVNENDTISTQGIRFGDNDTLSAVMAGMIKADYLFLLTDVDCLYTDNPRTNPDAKPVTVCDDMVKLREQGKILLKHTLQETQSNSSSCSLCCFCWFIVRYRWFCHETHCC